LQHQPGVNGRAVDARGLETAARGGPGRDEVGGVRHANVPPLHGEGRPRSGQGGDVWIPTRYSPTSLAAADSPTLRCCASLSLPIKGREDHARTPRKGVAPTFGPPETDPSI